MHPQAAFLPSRVSDQVYFDKAEIHLHETVASGPLVTSDGLLNKGAMATLLPESVVQVPIASESMGPGALDSFKRACAVVLSDLQTLTQDRSLTLQEIYSERLEWLGHPGTRAGEIWLQLFASGDFDLAWLVGSTVLEQLLGNMGVLKTMMGSPATLNIRNLLWHGFIIPQDQIPLDAYGSMLIVTTMTIAASTQKRFCKPLQVRHLQPWTYYHPDLPPLVTSGDFDTVYQRTAYRAKIPSLDWVAYSHDLEALIRKSKFVTSGTEQQWIEACRFLRQKDENLQFVFVMSSLPRVEHALRQIYVVVNGCKEDRKSALISGEYYLTLDVILDAFVPVDYFSPDSPVLNEQDPSSIPNKLHATLGPEIMNLLNDLFILGNGPRLRDRTSHGELNVYLTMDMTAEPWFGYYMGLVTHLLRQSISAPVTESEENTLVQCSSWIITYSSCRFDEWSILKKETARCQSLLSAYHSMITYISNSVDADHCERCDWIEIILKPKNSVVFSSQKTLSLSSVEDWLQVCLDAWPKAKPQDSGDSAFTGNNISAWINIIQGIQVAIQRVSVKVSTLSENLRQRQLSSRSRKQFEIMRPMIPRFLGMLAGCVALVEHSVLAWPSNATVPQVPCCPKKRVDLDIIDHSSGTAPLSLENLCLSSPSTWTFKPYGNGGTPIERSTLAEVRLRSRITMFVDKFVSNFDRGKLDTIEPAWADLTKCIDTLEKEEAREKQENGLE
ncbi:hypothetical protein BGX28_006111 [Mortierella sp. GBA30]|nr:hypothetical protein BGX28_006111 [Mortierella sp. GBA30]